MQSIYLNHFLNALAFALLNSLWQMALLWVVYQLFVAVFQPTAKHKYNILISTQFAGFSWLMITFFQSFVQGKEIVWKEMFIVDGIFTPDQLQKYLPVLSVFYLFFFGVQLVKFFIQFFITTHQIKQYQVYESEQWNLFTQRVAEKFNIYKKVVLKTTSDTVVPFTIGFLKPVIVIPVAALNNLSAQQLEAILIHELAHIKRHDYIVNMLLMLSEIIMCFNPFSLLLSKEINEVREFCCDDVVVNYPFAATQYAQALLNIAKSQSQQQMVTCLGAINSKQDLLFRINRMFNTNSFSEKRLPKMQIGFALFFGFLMFGLIGLIDSKVKEVIASNKPQIAIQNNIEKPLFKQVSYIEQEQASYKKEYSSNKKKLVVGNSIKTNDTSLLCLNKQIIADEFKEFANAIEQKQAHTVVNSDNQNIFSLDTIASNIALLNAVQRQAGTVVEKFIIPATSHSAASAILVTTTINDDGTKKVKIEIVKGNGQIE